MGELFERIRSHGSLLVKLAAGVIVIAVAAGVVFWVLGRGATSEQPSDDELTTYVTRDEQGRIIITNRDALEFSLSFPLPQNCEESKVLLRQYVTDNPERSSMTGDDQTTFAVIDRIAQDLCSYRDYRDLQIQEIEPWSQGAQSVEPSDDE